MQGLLLFSAFIAVSTALNSYIILVPKAIRPGENANITVSILDNLATNAGAKLVASLLDKNGHVLSQVSDTFRLHDPRVLQLIIPRNIDLEAQHQIRVEGKSGLLFYNTTDVDIETKFLSLLTQTDKGVYKAGQSVHIRSFGLHPNGSIYLGNISLEVIDPKGNIIKQWKDLREPMYGVVNKTFTMDDKPVLGNWKIKASSGNMSTETMFEVSEYVLPKFKLDMSVPNYVMVKDHEVAGTFSAKYTFGKAATGQLKLTVNIRGLSQQFMTWSGDMYTQSIHISGEKKFMIPLSHLRDHIALGSETVSEHINGLYLDVNATFTEELTGKVMSKSALVQFKKDSIQVDLLNTGSTRYLPGLDYAMKVQFTDNDGRPPTKPIGTFNISVTSTDINKVTSLVIEKVVSGPTTGMVDFSFKTPNGSINVEKLQVKVIYGTIEKTLDLIPYSANETHVKMRILSSDHKAGDQISVEIKSNNDMQSAMYQLVSRGALIKTGLLSFNTSKNTHLFDVSVTSDMTPEVTILVYGMDNEGRLYADQQTVSVKGILKNKVSLGFDIKQAEPGENVTLQIQSDPLSMVHLLAIDSSSLILSKGNQITEDRLMDDMESYTSPVKDKLFFYQRDCYGKVTEAHHDKLYAAYRFEEAGTRVMTDAAMYDIAHYKYHPYYDLSRLWQTIEKNCGNCCYDHTTTTTTTTTTTQSYPVYHTYPTYLPGLTYAPYPAGTYPMFTLPLPTAAFAGTYPPVFPGYINSGSGSGAFAGGGKGGGAAFGPVFSTTAAFFYPTVVPVMPNTEGLGPGKQTVAKVQRIRQNFPETWLWTTKLMGANGTEVIRSQVPDSITSWVATAFSINKQSGLGVSQNDAEINVFRPFFININLPFSVIHGEQVVLQINVFNYMDTEQSVIITLEQNAEFKNIVENGDGTTSLNSITATDTIQVQAGDSSSVFFPIVPEVIGKIDISVKAQTSMAADAVKRQLRVEPEGVPKEYNVPVIIDVSNSTEVHNSVPIEFPPSLVQGSERVHVFAIGDFMGPSVKGLDQLLTLPTGCGEQTMIGFAPDVFVYDYLKSSGQLTEEIADKALEFMDRGYQRELKFQHNDGSFSVWGPDDVAGSTWLTAFVLKSFHQAKNNIQIDQEVLYKAQKWIIRHQDYYSGFFSEERNVRHNSLQGGVDKTVSLTAFVTIALVESKDISKPTTNVDQAIHKAAQYLERQVQFLNDPYDIAISSYALLLAGSQKASEGITKLEMEASKPAVTGTTTPKPDCQDPPADIVFVLDSSGSIGSSNFQKILTFVKNMVQRLNLENHQTRVSVITFSTSTYKAFGLDDFNTKADIIDAVSRVPYYGGGTDTADALRFVRTNSFTANRNASKIVIVITDGNSNDRYATLREATALKNTGVVAFSVGIGRGISQSELQNIASGNNHVFLASDYQALQRVQISLGKENCRAPVRIPWTSSGKNPSYFWSSPNVRANPVDIETSAYVMLYYTKNREYIKGQNILIWILKQRNANGGFSSTQDTILALQAMSEIVKVVYGGSGNLGTQGSVTQGGQNLNINVNADTESHSFNVNSGNRMVLQSFQPSKVPAVVNISATGQGVALVQVSVNYNIKEQIEKPVFTMNLTITKESLETVITKTCTSYNGTGRASGMSIIEHGVLSGFEVDIEDVTANVDIKKIEKEDKIINIYLDEITTSATCVTVVAQRNTMVAKVKEAPVRVYDYYKPEHQVTTFYLPKTLKDSSYCDVCEECKCPKKTHGH